MKHRPFILKGNIYISNIDEYIIGKIIKNKNVNEEEKKQYIQVLDDNNLGLFKEGYKGYIFESKPKSINFDNLNYCYNIKYFETLIDYDVVEIINNKCIRLLYRDDSNDNVIVVTNQCNSNCIMCPDAEVVRNTEDIPYIDKILEQVRCIPNDTNHITITGGEPGMIKENLIRLLDECKKYLPDTDFLLLSNGRIFSNTEYTKNIKKCAPKYFRIAIPLYADNEKLHDEITQTKESFKQALLGIKKLIENNIDVEIRVVVLKKNYKKLENIAKYIAKEIPEVKMVNIMALEMTGNAFKNKKQVWVDFKEFKDRLYKSCIILLKAGIITNLYNFPLCNLDKRLYSIAHKSITDYKVRYMEQCEECLVKNQCGGFFNSTINVKSIKVNPIK